MTDDRKRAVGFVGQVPGTIQNMLFKQKLVNQLGLPVTKMGSVDNNGNPIILKGRPGGMTSIYNPVVPVSKIITTEAFVVCEAILSGDHETTFWPTDICYYLLLVNTEGYSRKKMTIPVDAANTMNPFFVFYETVRDKFVICYFPDGYPWIGILDIETGAISESLKCDTGPAPYSDGYLPWSYQSGTEKVGENYRYWYWDAYPCGEHYWGEHTGIARRIDTTTVISDAPPLALSFDSYEGDVRTNNDIFKIPYWDVYSKTQRWPVNMFNYAPVDGECATFGSTVDDDKILYTFWTITWGAIEWTSQNSVFDHYEGGTGWWLVYFDSWTAYHIASASFEIRLADKYNWQTEYEVVYRGVKDNLKQSITEQTGTPHLIDHSGGGVAGVDWIYSVIPLSGPFPPESSESGFIAPLYFQMCYMGEHSSGIGPPSSTNLCLQSPQLIKSGSVILVDMPGFHSSYYHSVDPATGEGTVLLDNAPGWCKAFQKIDGRWQEIRNVPGYFGEDLTTETGGRRIRKQIQPAIIRR